MRPQKRWIAAAGAFVAAVTLSACGILSGSSATSDPAGSGQAGLATTSDPAIPTPSVNTMSTTHGGLMEAKHTTVGLVLANPHGMTVYYYTGDKPDSGVSTCTGACAVTWPPVVAPVRLPAGLKLPGAIGFIVRAGGQRQVTVDGYPIYRYAGDKAPGAANGNGIGGKWHVIKIKTSSSGTSKSSTTGKSSTSNPSSSPSSGGGSGSGGW